MKKLGIIGGMGPLATQTLYKEIIDRTDAKCDQEHIDMIILSHASMPDRTESIKSGEVENIKSLLKKDAEFLESSGADMILIPCNTSHYFYEDIQSAVDIPIINMVSEAVSCAKAKGAKKLGVLATEGTIFAKVYENECKRQGIGYFAPSEDIQKLVTKIIYEQIKRGLLGSWEDFSKIDKHLREEGCDMAVLACTELSCFKKQTNLPDFYIDALEVLTERAIILSGAKLREEDK